MTRRHRSHGSGLFDRAQLRSLGEDVIFEEGVLVFHPENIEIGENVYVGHRTILKGYYRETLKIGDNCWIGQDCFFHSAGGLTIGRNVGIGPGVKIITSNHVEEGIDKPILFSTIQFAAVEVGDDSDIGVGAIILPGVRIGRGVQIGAGAIVTADVPDFAVAYGAPARVVRLRPGGTPVEHGI